jgi:hypothetical protein
MTRAIERWAAALVAREIRAAAGDPQRYVRRTKQKDPPSDEDQLRALLLRFGLTHGADAANGAAGSRIIPGTLVRDVIAGKPVKIVWFERWVRETERRAARVSASTRERVRESVRTILADADAEDVRPTVAEIAHRIRTQIHAVEPAKDPAKDRVYVFSAPHAELIARTELAQAENTGRMAGYEATGVEEIEWLAYVDGRSGDRHHERMNHVRAALGSTFVLPSGARLRYPGDPVGPIAETANCRCTVRPAKNTRRGVGRAAARSPQSA